LFKLVQRTYNNASKVRKTSQSPGAKALGNALGAYKDDQLTKRQCVHTTTNTTPIATTCKVKDIKMKISKSIQLHRLNKSKSTIS